jgi:cell envelope opacity-associated protein A
MKFLRIGLIVTAISAFSLAALLSFHSKPAPEISIKITPYQGSQPNDKEVIDSQATPNSLVKVHYFVKVGDTLSNIFSSWQLPYGTVQKVMEADLESLKLDTIKPGDHLELLLDSDSKQLVELIYHESLVEQAAFT